ncbi:MAG: hypothetical protein HKN22_05330, partial [Bacteroidia bacterium]|nr:hypothetical protein [Bacteroidia bacterium]
PTLDDEDRAGVNDFNDPFGGNDGKNQAKITVNSPLQVYSPGWRNPYDVIITSKNKLYSIDNAGNLGWGGPALFDSLGNCTNQPNEINSATHLDPLHLIPSAGYYRGHPNPTRANTSVTFNSSNPQAAVDPSLADGHCNYLVPGSGDGAMATFPTSTNGFAEYTASNFSGAMTGDLIATCFNENVYRIQLNDSGTVATANTVLFSGFGSDPLDVICLNDSSPFPGTIWVCTYGSNSIAIFEPNDFTTCTGINSSYSLDDDDDGFSNADETDNGTDPCNNGSRPSDFDGDNLSDLNDPDDDNDGIPDVLDKYALDFDNGTITTLPHRLDFDNSAAGGIEGWGFTGMMINGTSNYRDLYDLNNVSIGGAAYKFTIDSIPAGDALGSQNDQEYGFQMGVNVSTVSTPFTVKCRILGAFSTIVGSPVNDQSFGMHIGEGDQDNYLKYVCHANSGNGGLRILLEDSGIVTFDSIYNIPILDSTSLILSLSIDPTSNMVTPYYSYDLGVTTYSLPSLAIPSDWIQNIMACGFLSTSGPNPGNEFPATWDWIDVRVDPVTVLGDWKTVPDSLAPVARHENAFIQVGDKMILLGGRGIKPVDIYDINTQTWTQGAASPVELHHFQAVELNGLIYCVGAFDGFYPAETKVKDVWIYDVVGDKWMQGPTIPTSRQRGSAAAAVYNNKIYVVGGLTHGHYGTWTNFLDEYDPATNTWTTLSPAPRTRDHFRAVVVNDKMYCIGGMASGHGSLGLDSVRAKIDVYNFTTSTWSTLHDSTNFPLPRSGPSAGLIGNEIILFGGESNNQLKAHCE